MNKSFLATIVAIVSVAGFARAQSVEDFTLDPKPMEIRSLSDSAARDWRFSFMLYIWVPGFNGDIGAGDNETGVSNNPINILDNLSAAFLGEAEVNAGPFSLIANGMYLGFEWDDLGPRDRGTAELDGYILDVVVGWRVGEWQCGKNGKVWLQPLVGFRYYDLELTLDVDDLGDVEVGTDLFDPVVGARLVAECGNWVFKLRGDVGGFGVGTELSWLADASVSYWFGKHFFITLGYKALGLDMDDDSGDDRIVLDGVLHGPYLGVGFAL